MRIFVSFASEHRDLAESIAIRLRQDGHHVFFDRTSLPPGEQFDRAIRDEIAHCDLFIFLISPESVAQGGYAMSELQLAQRRSPDASRLLPVMIAPTPQEDIPVFAKAVTILSVHGNPTAEVAAAVAAIERKKSRKRMLLAGVLLVLATITAGVLTWLIPEDNHNRNGSKEPCFLGVQVSAPAQLLPGLTLRVSGGNEARDFSVTASGTANIDVGTSQLNQWKLVVIDRDGIRHGELVLDGCPEAAVSSKLEGGISLEIIPRR